MTLAELKPRIARFLEDPQYTRFTEAVLLDEINQSQKRIVLETRCLTDKQAITCVDGTSEYDLPTDYLVSIRVTHKNLDIKPTSKNILDFYTDEDWTDDTGTPKEYCIDIRDPDSKKIIFYPIPQSGDAGNNIVNEYIVNPADLADALNVPFNSHALLAPYHDSIVHDVVQSLKQQDQMTPETLQKIAFHQGERDKVIQKIVRTFNNASNKPWRIRGGRTWNY